MKAFLRLFSYVRYLEREVEGLTNMTESMQRYIDTLEQMKKIHEEQIKELEGHLRGNWP
jgi:prefoldin subunit 5